MSLAPNAFEGFSEQALKNVIPERVEAMVHKNKAFFEKGEIPKADGYIALWNIHCKYFVIPILGPAATIYTYTTGEATASHSIYIKTPEYIWVEYLKY